MIYGGELSDVYLCFTTLIFRAIIEKDKKKGHTSVCGWADEKQMIVDAFKQYINTDGKIITSIFEVANQSALLEGEYEGYRVLFEDDLEYKA